MSIVQLDEGYGWGIFWPIPNALFKIITFEKNSFKMSCSMETTEFSICTFRSIQAYWVFFWRGGGVNMTKLTSIVFLSSSFWLTVNCLRLVKIMNWASAICLLTTIHCTANALNPIILSKVYQLCVILCYCNWEF